MVIAGTRPILQTTMTGVRLIARVIPLPGSMGFYFTVLSLVPLLGSFITEPAAMTLAARILADSFFDSGISSRLKYATLGVLFVNISIGGTLTPFAAPPVLMVTGKWNWDFAFMLSAFGWKAAITVVVNAVGATLLFRKELRQPDGHGGDAATRSESIAKLFQYVRKKIFGQVASSMVIRPGVIEFVNQMRRRGFMVGVEHELFVGPIGEQDYAKQLVTAFI